MIGKLDEIDSICSVKSSLIKDINESMTGSNIHSEGYSHTVPEKYSQEINQILHEYNDIFSKNDHDIAETNLLKMKIEINDSNPINVPPYRVQLDRRKAVEKAVEDMLESGIVRPSISPYNAPVVAVKKPNSDSYRICIDFRAENSIKKPVAQPLDNIDDILASLGKAKYLTKLDLKSAYHNMCLVEEDKEETAFSVGHKHLEFNRVPFGLINSGAYFSQLMSIIYKGIKGVYVINYLDDILVYSEDFKSHLLHLKEVFRRLRHANLRLNLSKCEFVKTSVDYLGHVIDGNGLRPSPHKVAAIQIAPQPINIRGVRSFVGLLSYYRRYISKF